MSLRIPAPLTAIVLAAAAACLLPSTASAQATQPIERIAKDTDRDNFMDAEAAVAYGIVDAVLDRRPDDSVQAS